LTGEVLLRSPEIAQQALEAYLKHRAGPFTNAPTPSGFVSLEMVDPSLAEAEKHVRSVVADYHKEHPNSDPAGRDAVLAKQLLSSKEAIGQTVFLGVGFVADHAHTPSMVFVHDAPGNWVTLGICSTRSFSRGSVHIESLDPTKQPVIDPAYYAHPLDLDIAGRSVLYAMNLALVEPLASTLKKDHEGNLILHPSWEGDWPKTLDEAKEFVSANTVTEYHPIGTCAMLPREKGGVVDSQCKVYGTTNVRVVDASIYPTHVQGNIVSLTYAVAEKAADIIKGRGDMNQLK
jgi:choline dehydrogenase-like flavoprotein